MKIENVGSWSERRPFLTETESNLRGRRCTNDNNLEETFLNVTTVMALAFFYE